MFLKYSSYIKPKLDQQIEQTFSNKKQPQLPTQDQYAFTDFFIRKGNQSNQKSINKNEIRQKTNQSTTKNNNFLENNQELFKSIHDTVFCLPPKKAFDIKYMTQKLKPKKNSPFRSLLKKQNSQKFKSKKQHVIDRKLEPFLSLKGSARYKKQRKTDDQRYSESIPRQLAEKGKSFQFSVNFAQPNKNNDEINIQRRQPNLLSAYKIKSLILQRNPKQQILDRTKKYLRKQIDKKFISNNSHLQSARTQSEQPYDTFSKVQLDESRLTTQQKTDKKSYKDEMNLSSRERNNVRFSSLRQNAKINLKTTAKKQISIFPLDENFSNNKQVTLQPWIKSTYQQDIFSENIQQGGIEFQPFKTTIDTSPNPLSIINTGHRTTRTSHRKIFSTKNNSKNNKLTIRSEK